MAQSNSKPPIGHNFSSGGLHCKTSSQTLSYGNNCFHLFSTLPQSESSLASSNSVKDASMEELDVSSNGPSLVLGSASSSYAAVENKFKGNFNSLPPRIGHRRANSEVPLGFDAFIQTTPQLIPISGEGGIFGKGNNSYMNDKSGFSKAMHLEKQERDRIYGGVEERKSEGEVIDGFFSSYINLDSTERFPVSGNEDDDKRKVMIHDRNTGEGVDKDGESGSIGNIGNMIHRTMLREPPPNKRSADVDLAPTARHFRSLSVDSAFGNLNFGVESQDLTASFGKRMSELVPNDSSNENSAMHSLEFGNGEFTEYELKRIKMDERLAEVAVVDPKRAKRILANRQSAARSKERKMHYISELEHKVQTLQSETTNLSAQLTVFQKEITELTNHNNELKIRLKAMEQQTRLRDALHESLAEEVKHLKLAAMELGEDGASARIIQHMHLKHQMIHMDRQQFSVGTSKSTTTTSATPASA